MRILTQSEVSDLRAAASFFAARNKPTNSRFLTDEYREMLAGLKVGDCIDIFEDMSNEEQAAVKAIVAAKGIVTDKETLAGYRKVLNSAKSDLRTAVREILGADANVQTTVDEGNHVYGALITSDGDFGYLVRRTA